MNIRPIRTEEDLTWALAEVEPYFLNEPAKDSEDAVRFEVLADLIRAYEALHWSIGQSEVPAAADQRYLYRGVAYTDRASVRTAIRTGHAGKMLRRKSDLMSASSGRFVVRPARRARRALKTG